MISYESDIYLWAVESYLRGRRTSYDHVRKAWPYRKMFVRHRSTSRDLIHFIRVTLATIGTISYDDARWPYDDVCRRINATAYFYCLPPWVSTLLSTIVGVYFIVYHYGSQWRTVHGERLANSQGAPKGGPPKTRKEKIN